MEQNKEQGLNKENWQSLLKVTKEIADMFGAEYAQDIHFKVEKLMSVAKEEGKREENKKVLVILSGLNVENSKDPEWHAGVSAAIDAVEYIEIINSNE